MRYARRTSPFRSAIKTRRGSATFMLVALLVAVAVAVGAGAYYYYNSDSSDTGEEAILYDVTTGPFDHIVLEQGEIESSSNVEYVCNVKSRNQGGTAILWVIDEGAPVKPGDLLVELDSSGLEQELKQQKIIVNSAQAALISAESVLEQANVAKSEYLEGTFAQEEKTIESEILVAEEQLSRAKETAKYSEQLAARGFQTPLQLRADQFAVKKAEVDLNLAQQKLKTLREITKRKMLIGFDAEIETAKANVEAQRSSLEEELEKQKDLEDQIKGCKIYADKAGQVVHANQYSSRGGSAEFVVEAGSTVRERQAIIRLPDPEMMRVKAKINESQVSLVKENMPVAVKVGAFDDRLKGVVTKVNKYAEPSSWFSSQVKEYATFISIVDPPPTIRTGMTAEVQIFVQQLEDVLQVPVQALCEVKGHFFCLVPEGKKWKTVEVEIGATNDKTATITKGLSEGDQVVMNPRQHMDKLQLPDIPDPPKVEVDPALAKKAAAEAPDSGGPGAGRGGPGAGRGGPGAPGGRGGPGGAGGGGFNPAAIVQRIFSQYDTDKDGKLSQSEMSGMERSPAQADTNGDGAVDQAELLQRFQNFAQQRGGGQ